MNYPNCYTEAAHGDALDRLLADIKAHGEKTTALCADTREKLDRLSVRLDMTRDQLDNIEAAYLAGLSQTQLVARLRAQRRDDERREAPHGRCPICYGAVSYEPDSDQSEGVHRWTDRGGYFCPDCELPLEWEELEKTA